MEAGSEPTSTGTQGLVEVNIQPSSFSNGKKLTFFENQSLKLTIEKTHYKRGTRFSYMDSLFNIKLEPKINAKLTLYFKDLLEILDLGLKHILKELILYFPNNPNALTFLTLFQNGMTNGLSTGGFDLSENSDQLVNKLMQILYNFMLSSQDLAVNEGFKIFVDVYSKDHQRSTKKKVIYKGRIGRMDNELGSYWSIDLRQSLIDKHKFLKDKCLLIAVIFGHLQNCYFESNYKDQKFVNAQRITNSCVYKQNMALNILKQEYDCLEKELEKRNCDFNSDLEILAPILHDLYQCQLVVFSARNYRIHYMFPKNFDETLRPIFLFDTNQSLSSDKHNVTSSSIHHIIFIRHLVAFFRATKTKSCFYCKSVFKKIAAYHRCLARQTCFACKRYAVQRHRNPHQMLAQMFCFGDQSLQVFYKQCAVCNLKLLDKACAKAHAILCGNKGWLGYKCPRCNKFISRSKNVDRGCLVTEFHTCGEVLCKTCKRYFSFNDEHLCALNKYYFPNDNKSLVFLNVEFIFDERESIGTNEEPNIFSIYKERKAKSGIFDFYEVSDFCTTFETTLDILQTKHLEETNQANAQKAIITTEFMSKVRKLQDKEANTPSEKFVKLVTSWSEIVVICSDNDGFVFNAVIKAFLKANININIFTRNKTFFSCSIPELNIRILNLKNYLPGNQNEIAKFLKVDFTETFFPTKMNKKNYYFYSGSVPSLETFDVSFDTEDVLKRKAAFVENYSGIWNFQTEIKKYSRQKVHLMAANTCSFLKEMTNFQMKLFCIVSSQNPNKSKLLFPFSNNICTMSGFVYKLFKGLFLNDEDIFVVDHEYHVPSRKVSQTEYKFCKYMEFKFPDVNFIHNFSNPAGQSFFKECIPDIYIPEYKTAIFVNGCYFHGHYFLNDEKSNFTDSLHCLNSNKNLDTFNEITDCFPDQTHCIMSKPFLPDKVNKKLNKTYFEIQEEFHQKVESLKKNNPDRIKNVQVIWECFYNKLLSKSLTHQKFMSSFIKHPLQRLLPRDCSTGGLVQAFALKWTKKLFSKETLFCCDINGLYSYSAINNNFNVGKYTIIMGKLINNLSIKDNLFFYEGKKVYGVAQVRVLAPKNLFCPFLVFKNKQSSFLTLCQRCTLKKIRKCKHSDTQREFYGTYFIEELEFALCLGYQVTAVFECHAYFDQKPIFRKFVSILNYFKTKHSSYLENIVKSEKNSYCQYLNEKMKLEMPFLLTTEGQQNDFKKMLFKLMANSLFGKLQQRQDKMENHIFTDDDELNQFIEKHKNEVQSIECYEDILCQVSINPDKKKINTSLNTNCYLGAEIVAKARIYFYKQIQKVLSIDQSTLYYIDTDCIFFSLPKDIPNPLIVSDAVGDFKNVYDNITNFYCLGPKNYVLSYLNKNKEKVITKVSGLNLTSFKLQNSLNPVLYKYYLSSFLKHKFKSSKVPQPRIKRLKTKFSNKLTIEMVTFSNKLHIQRYVNNRSLKLQTFPYGY